MYKIAAFIKFNKSFENIVLLQKDKIKFNDDTLAYINSTLPNNVAFKIEKQSTANKFVDPLIRA